ncbi:hypothetical protein SDC9_168230 [bioreactor metagenome]|uniref:Uncharacterized protein n=1 Tax=bioreactor metagenome TaxID=1076179 RepID=A0A645G201_9ZZZZ
MLMYSMCDQTMRRHIRQIIHGTARRKQPALTVWGNPYSDNQTHTTFCPFAKICGQFRIIIKTVFQTGMHGTHHDTVFNGRKAQM